MRRLYLHSSKLLFPKIRKIFKIRRKFLDLRRVLWYNIIPLNEGGTTEYDVRLRCGKATQCRRYAKRKYRHPPLYAFWYC